MREKEIKILRKIVERAHVYREEGNLSLSYCAVDNLICINLDMSLMKFESCSMENIKIIDSNIRQWRFWDSDVTGEIINSKLNVVNVFNPVLIKFLILLYHRLHIQKEIF